MAQPTVLVVASWEPPVSLAEQAGPQHRMRLFVEAFRALGASLTMAHFVSPGFARAHTDLAALEALQARYWGLPVALRLIARTPPREETFLRHYLAPVLRAEDHPFFHSFTGPEQVAALGQLLDSREWDLVLINRPPAMLATLLSGRRPPRAAFDQDDLEHRVEIRRALLPPRSPGRFLHLLRVPAVVALELRGTAATQLTFVCSEEDRAHQARFGWGGRLMVVPNALALPPEPPPLPAEPSVLFLGGLNHPPNRRAAVRLATRILPRLRAEIPGARALIGGAGTEALGAELGQPEGAEFLGFVPDLDALYARTRVVACPLEGAGGTRLKLLEGAGQARPIVSTVNGAEGLGLRDGIEALLRDDDAGFAAACARLMRDDALASSLGQAARAHVAARFDASAITAALTERLRPLVTR
jgi:glycosyltransferase involved in cell wall biosynthesis